MGRRRKPAWELAESWQGRRHLPVTTIKNQVVSIKFLRPRLVSRRKPAPALAERNFVNKSTECDRFWHFASDHSQSRLFAVTVDLVHQHCNRVRRRELRDAVPQVEDMSAVTPIWTLRRTEGINHSAHLLPDLWFTRE